MNCNPNKSIQFDLIGVQTSDKQKPLFSYSNRSLLAINAGFGIFWLYALTSYVLVEGAFDLYQILPFTLLSLVFIFGFYSSWHQPLRRARFYDDHFEISGWNVKIWSGYRDIEGLEKHKMRVFSDTRVRFSVRGSPAKFRFSNEKNRKLKLDLYSWLIQKTQS
jgi:hypothetical protein